MDYFIDPKGTKHVGRALLADWQWAAAYAGGSAHPYLVHNAGYVHLDITGRCLKITIDFERASINSMVTLTRELVDYHVDIGRPVFISDGPRIMRQFANGYMAMDFIVARIEDRAASLCVQFRRRSIAMTGPSRLAFRQLASLCSATDVIDLTRLQAVLRSKFADRYCVVRPDRDGSRLVLVSFGTGYQHLDGNWEHRRAGTPFGEFDDPAYSTFVKRAYAEAWDGWKPTLEEIEAPMFADPLPRKYERILLPIVLGTGPAMLSATLVTNQGDASVCRAIR